MPAIVKPIPVGSRIVDTVEPLTLAMCKAFKASGVDGVFQYLGQLTADRKDMILGEGLGLCAVGFAEENAWQPTAAHGAQRGQEMVVHAHRVGLVEGLHLWRDLEGCAGDSLTTSLDIEAGAAQVVSADFLGGLYVGAGQALNAGQLYRLRDITAYWQSLSRGIPEPDCGFVLKQLYPSSKCCGVLVDYSFAQEDFQGRSATWLVAS